MFQSIVNAAAIIAAVVIVSEAPPDGATAADITAEMFAVVTSDVMS